MAVVLSVVLKAFIFVCICCSTLRGHWDNCNTIILQVFCPVLLKLPWYQCRNCTALWVVWLLSACKHSGCNVTVGLVVLSTSAADHGNQGIVTTFCSCVDWRTGRRCTERTGIFSFWGVAPGLKFPFNDWLHSFNIRRLQNSCSFLLALTRGKRISLKIHSLLRLRWSLPTSHCHTAPASPLAVLFFATRVALIRFRPLFFPFFYEFSVSHYHRKTFH